MRTQPRWGEMTVGGRRDAESTAEYQNSQTAHLAITLNCCFTELQQTQIRQKASSSVLQASGFKVGAQGLQKTLYPINKSDSIILSKQYLSF